MKLFDNRGKFLGNIEFKPAATPNRLAGSSDPGCLAAIVLSVGFIVYAILMSHEAGPTWYWVLSWLVFPWISFFILTPLTSFAEGSCFGMLIGVILGFLFPAVMIFLHMMLTAILWW